MGRFVHRHTPRLFYHLAYYRAARRLGDRSRARERLFRELVAGSEGKPCLQIGVRDQKYAPHWVSVDLYDHSDYIDYNYDIHALEFEDGTFDVVVCNAVLEHVEDPLRAISELRRVLRKGGRIWVEVPFNQPYHPSPNDYWRVTPDGMRLWMKDFTEISSGLFRIDKSAVYNGVYFYGEQ